MAWEHLSITKPHLVYIILGGFTSLFMLCSSVIKERLYIGEATVATICGIIFGPHAADLINPRSWGNVDLITLEFSRIVLVVQCFAVGVELPRAYMEKHWRSVTLLLVPVMTFGWLMTSLFVWGLFHSHLSWLDSLCIAACVTATDPVLASSVVGKGKFAKRVPKHLRDLLSAESGCNDGMAFPFVYLPLYLIRYRPHASEVAFHWICYTILYECIFGAVYGVMVGYFARRAIRWAHENDVIDRESFLVFYFVLALFCAGSGSLLGVDDLLVGFACGVGFSNDGWFLEKTEESHVSNVIDLLINLAFFVYFGTIIPWEQFNAPVIGMAPWRLVVLGLLVLFFRRIPVMLMMKPLIPDIKTWREALFAGHFGPIGVGGIFVAILARAELETEETTPLAVLPEPGFEHLNIIEMIWPITCFLVICSILVHGSSIAVFTLGKHINTLSISLSYTQGPDQEGPSWMDRLPRIQSRSRTSMSLSRRQSESSSFDEKVEVEKGQLPPIGIPGQFLRRQKEEESQSRSGSQRPNARRRKWDSGKGPGGPISRSAIKPRRGRQEEQKAASPMQDSDTLAAHSDESPGGTSSPRKKLHRKVSEEEIYQEGDKTVFEDEEGNVLGMRTSGKGETAEERKRLDNEKAAELGEEHDVEDGVAQTEHGGELEQLPGKVVEAVKQGVEHPSTWRQRMQSFSRHPEGAPAEPPKAQKPPQRRGPALAYQFGNTIIVEDEDGEVIKKYDIPATSARPGMDRKGSMADTGGRAINSLRRMGTYMGFPFPGQTNAAGPSDPQEPEVKDMPLDADDERIRFTVTAGGRRMSKHEFIQQMSHMDPKSRAKFVQDSDVPEPIKEEARQDARDHTRQRAASSANIPAVVGEEGQAELHKVESPEARQDDRKRGPEGLTLVDSDDEDVPFHNMRDTMARHSKKHGDHGETAAQRRRRLAGQEAPASARDAPVDPLDADETPAEQRRRLAALQGTSSSSASASADEVVRRSSATRAPRSQAPASNMDDGETAAERRRRLGALGVNHNDDSAADSSPDSDSDAEEAGDPLETGRGTHGGGDPSSSATGAPHGQHQKQGQHSGLAPPQMRTPGIRFADQPRVPTKDERAATDAAEKQRQGEDASKSVGKAFTAGKLRLRWGKK